MPALPLVGCSHWELFSAGTAQVRAARAPAPDGMQPLEIAPSWHCASKSRTRLRVYPVVQEAHWVYASHAKHTACRDRGMRGGFGLAAQPPVAGQAPLKTPSLV